MDHETIPRSLYLKLVEDGMRVDRVRMLVSNLRNGLKDASSLSAKRLTQQLISKIQIALMDTPEQYEKLEKKKREIRMAEEEITLNIRKHHADI